MPRGMRARRYSHSTPGRIAAAIVNARKSSAMTHPDLPQRERDDDDRDDDERRGRRAPRGSSSFHFRGIPYAKENQAS